MKCIGEGCGLVRVDILVVEVKKLSESKKNSGHKILQYSLTGEYIKTWDNIDEVAKTLGVSRESIAGCCRGKSKTAHKFIWKYK